VVQNEFCVMLGQSVFFKFKLDIGPHSQKLICL
jgi:hypothetical protein